MAVFLNNNVGVKINSVDLSTYVTSVTLNRTFDELEVTAMGDGGHRFVKGLEAATVTIDLNNDSAATTVLPTLQAAWGTNVPIVLLQTKGTAVSATNPLYTMTCLINNTTDINGAVGDLGMMSLSFNVSGTVAVTTTGTF
jgi:hypothetical protein